jgi:hypothetical protein
MYDVDGRVTGTWGLVCMSRVDRCMYPYSDHPCMSTWLYTQRGHAPTNSAPLRYVAKPRASQRQILRRRLSQDPSALLISMHRRIKKTTCLTNATIVANKWRNMLASSFSLSRWGHKHSLENTNIYRRETWLIKMLH